MIKSHPRHRFVVIDVETTGRSPRYGDRVIEIGALAIENGTVEECIAAHWSTRRLERQVNSFYYERLLKSRDKEPVRKEIQALEPGPQSEDIIKDPYVLEFLQLQENVSYQEKDLESALIGKLQEFLLELGRGFPPAGAWIETDRRYWVREGANQSGCNREIT